MSERTEYPDGVPCWVTALEPDPVAACAFYAGLLGWTTAATKGFFTAQRRGLDVAAIAPPPEGVDGATWITQISVDSADATTERARAAGAAVLAEPFEEPMGRLAVIADPTGAVFSVKEPGQRFGAQVVNEPGAWAMSCLGTPDPDAATTFYAEVFGWTTETFGNVTLLRLPGYVGGEPQQGGWGRVREVIAVMRHDPDVAAWVPDFWVGDLDAALEKVGTVHAGPVEQPPGRTALVSSPAGAVFTLTQLSL